MRSLRPNNACQLRRWMKSLLEDGRYGYKVLAFRLKILLPTTSLSSIHKAYLYLYLYSFQSSINIQSSIPPYTRCSAFIYSLFHCLSVSLKRKRFSDSHIATAIPTPSMLKTLSMVQFQSILLLLHPLKVLGYRRSITLLGNSGTSTVYRLMDHQTPSSPSFGIPLLTPVLVVFG